MVSRSGSAASGEFCHSLHLTDIYPTWTEARAVLGKGQEAVGQTLDEMRQALPVPLQGIDSDHGSEFIHAHLYRYSRSQHRQFPRGRPYNKDDNAPIEQKNGTPVRRLLGYLRYDSAEALQAINDLYRNELRLFPNLFWPAVQLASKLRIGSRLRRRYQTPPTPFQRLGACASPAVDHPRVAELQRLRDTLDPFLLSQIMPTKLERIFQLRAEALRNQTQRSTVSNGFHRPPQKENSSKKERENDPPRFHSQIAGRSAQNYILILRDRGSKRVDWRMKSASPQKDPITRRAIRRFHRLRRCHGDHRE